MGYTPAGRAYCLTDGTFGATANSAFLGLAFGQLIRDWRPDLANIYLCWARQQACTSLSGKSSARDNALICCCSNKWCVSGRFDTCEMRLTCRPTTTELATNISKVFGLAACHFTASLAALQARYMVGEIGNSFVVGYGKKSPILIQDAASSCPLSQTASCTAIQVRTCLVAWHAESARLSTSLLAAGQLGGGQPLDGEGRACARPSRTAGRAAPVAQQRRDDRAGAPTAQLRCCLRAVLTERAGAGGDECGLARRPGRPHPGAWPVFAVLAVVQHLQRKLHRMPSLGFHASAVLI